MTYTRYWRPSLPQTNEATAKVLKFLGLAAKAGRTVAGVSLICTALSRGARDKTPLLVIQACDASANSRKRIADRTAFYGVPTRCPDIDGATLAHAIGKREGVIAAVGVTEQHLAAAILEALQN